jgi:WhiB family redox-sensing transcriptional regulator
VSGKANVAHLEARAFQDVDTWWHHRSACRDEDPELFHHPDNERGAPRVERANDAKRICRKCPVAVLCLEAAVKIDETHAVRGGFDFSDEKERRQARRSVRKEVAA